MRRVLPVVVPLVLAATLLGVWAPAPAAVEVGATSRTAKAPDPVTWLCKPGLRRDPCEIGTDTTEQKAGRPGVVRRPPRPAQAQRKIDCFYVYPTVSNQPRPTATKARDPELVSIAKYQAARFSRLCRVYAPIYRQTTLAGVATIALAGPDSVGYRDVRQAWRTYLARYNKGRGVVLIGHSQGSIVLRELIRQEIDRRPAVRRRLVGAVLMGGNVTVRAGRDRGGDFRNVRTCTRRGQVGCVVAYSTYAADAPVAFFGNSRTDPTARSVSGPSGDGYEVACTDPVKLAGMPSRLAVTVPSEPFAPGPINLGIAVTVSGDVPTARTTWVRPPDRFAGRCRTVNGARVYRYDPVGPQSRRPHEFPPTWGTHLLDMNLGLEHLLRIVQRQRDGWLRR